MSLSPERLLTWSGGSPLPEASRQLLVFLIYTAAAGLGLAVSPLGGVEALVWPASGVALAAVLLGGRRYLPVVIGGGMLAYLQAGALWAPSLLMALGNALAAWLGATLLRRARVDAGLERLRDALLLALVAPVAAIVPALITGLASLMGTLPAALASVHLPFRWAGHTVGCLAVAPLILCWSAPARGPSRARGWPERAVQAVVTLLVALMVTGVWRPPTNLAEELYLVFPPLLWAATRLGQRGAATTTFLVACVGLGAAAAGLGPFHSRLGQGPVHLQAFLSVYSLTGLVLGAVVAERGRAAQALAAAHGLLESRVGERTAELARMNEELQLREQELLQVQRLALVGSWSWDPACDRVTWSEDMAALLGRAQQSSSLAGFLELVHPDDLPRFAHALEAARAGQPMDLEHRVLRPDGSVRHVNQRAKLFPSPLTRKVIGSALDITARKEAEHAQRRQRWADLAHYRAIVESAGAAIISADLSGQVTSWNTGAERLYGWSWEEAMGRPLTSLIAASPGEDVLAWRLLRPGDSVEVREVQRRRKGGELLSVALTLSPILGEGGEPVGVSEVSQDLTERKLAEERFRMAVEAAPNAMLLVDRAGRVVLANHQTELVLGYQRVELLGRAVESLFPDDDAARRQLTRLFEHVGGRQEVGQGGDLELRRRDGSQVAVELGLTPVQTGEGTFVLASIVDITERLRTEQQLKNQAEELARSNAELEKFAYVTSHDLQEPIRMVGSFCQLLRREYGARLDERGERWLSFAVEGAERMQRLVEDLLDYSRVQTRPRELERTDLQRVVDEVLSNLDPTGQEARIEVGELPAIVADQSQMLRLFQNLLANALKFRSQRPLEIRISAEPQGEGWLFRVRDNGIGIPPAHTERIFELFKRLHPRERYPGTGIGLAMCRTIVQRHGGRIWVESTPGEGSTFLFFIPGMPTRVTPRQAWSRQRIPASGPHQVEPRDASGPIARDPQLTDGQPHDGQARTGEISAGQPPGAATS